MTEPGHARVSTEMLAGQKPTCLDCGRVLLKDDARIAVRTGDRPNSVLWRCGDCQYLRDKSGSA